MRMVQREGGKMFAVAPEALVSVNALGWPTLPAFAAVVVAVAAVAALVAVQRSRTSP